MLGDTAGVIAAQKACTLTGVDWGFEESEAQQTSALQACAKMARRKAEGVADALGVRLGAVHRFDHANENGIFPRGRDALGGGAPGSMKRRMTSEDLGIFVVHKKKVRTEVVVKFRLSS